MASRRRRGTAGPRTERERALSAIAPEALERAALAYLERYETSAANLGAVLERRIRRADQRLRWNAAGDAVEPLPVTDALAEAARIVEKLVGLGYVDDRRFADGLVRELRRRGSSRRAILQKLRQKGVDDAVAEEVIAVEGDDAELASALAYARRRGLGPFRQGSAEEREARRERDLAALARAGFGVELSLRVVDGDRGGEPSRKRSASRVGRAASARGASRSRPGSA